MTQESSDSTLGGAATGFAHATKDDIAALMAALPPAGSVEITVAANTTPMTLTAQNTFYKWTTGWADDTTPIGFTRDLTGGTLTANIAARVITTAVVNFSLNTATGVHIAIFKNGSPLPEHLVTIDVVNTDSALAATISGMEDCSPGDVFDLRIEDTGHSGSTVVFYNVNFSIYVIGKSP
jgi:hypothetical protein